MMMDNAEVSVLYKHEKEHQWTLAQPNLERKALTQDQLREDSMKYLTPEQRRHFMFNVQLNRKGSLFGPQRDGQREKTPKRTEEDYELVQSGARANSAPSVSNLRAANGTSMQSMITSRFPMTNDSVRGSDILSNMRGLGSMLPSMMAIGEGNPSRFSSHVAISQASFISRKHTNFILEKQSILNIEDWINIEQKGEYVGKRKHFLRVINTLDYDEKIIQVSNYQTLNELVQFYRENYNINAHNYLWKDIWGNTLEFHKSLGENGLMDRSLIIDELGLDHFPTILIYFKDGFEYEPLMRLDISKPEPDGITVPCRNY